MRIMFRSILLMVLCLIPLTGCTGQNTPPAPTTATPEQCTKPGTFQRVNSNASLPKVEGNWPLFRGDLQRQGAGPAGGSKLELAWSYCMNTTIFASPVVQDGVVYTAAIDRSVAALDIQQAKVRWQFQADAGVYSTPVVQGEYLYFGTLNGTFYALNRQTGRVQWQTEVEPSGSNIWSSPVVANGLVIFGVASTLSEKPKVPGQVIALDTATGKQRWRTFTQANGAPGAGVWSSPAVDITQNSVYIGTGDPDDGVQALRLTDGKLLWHWRSTERDVTDTDIGAGPLIYTDSQGQKHVVVGGKDGYLYNLNAHDGRLLWKTRISDQVFSAPAFSNGTLYVVGTERRSATAMALDAETGKIRWQAPLTRRVYSSPISAGQQLYITTGDSFGDNPGDLVILDATNGHGLQDIDLGSAASASPTLLSSWLFVGTHEGKLLAFARR